MTPTIMPFSTREALAAYFWETPGLESLEMSGDMAELPKLPESLKTVWIENAPNLRRLPALPKSLCWLVLHNCPLLNAVPELPESTSQVVIHNCAISTITRFPATVTDVRVSGCPDFEFPQLPPRLEILIAGQFTGQALPRVPRSLKYLGVKNCPNLLALPELHSDSVAVEVTNCPHVKGSSCR